MTKCVNSPFLIRGLRRKRLNGGGEQQANVGIEIGSQGVRQEWCRGHLTQRNAIRRWIVGVAHQSRTRGATSPPVLFLILLFDPHIQLRLVSVLPCTCTSRSSSQHTMDLVVNLPARLVPLLPPLAWTGSAWSTFVTVDTSENDWNISTVDILHIFICGGPLVNCDGKGSEVK